MIALFRSFGSKQICRSLTQQKELNWTSSSPVLHFHHILQLLFLQTSRTWYHKSHHKTEKAHLTNISLFAKKSQEDETLKAAFHMAQYYNKCKCSNYSTLNLWSSIFAHRKWMQMQRKMQQCPVFLHQVTNKLFKPLSCRSRVAISTVFPAIWVVCHHILQSYCFKGLVVIFHCEGSSHGVDTKPLAGKDYW